MNLAASSQGANQPINLPDTPRRVYLDHAAATPVSHKALNAMLPYFREQFFNPSAPYLQAKHVREAYLDAKNRLAHCIGAKGNDLIITSGATEANHIAFSCVDGIRAALIEKAPHRRSPEAVVAITEHISVLGNAMGHDFALVNVDKRGRIDLKDLDHAISPETVIVSVSLANNELGTIQPIAEISQIIARERLSRQKSYNSTPIYLHVDASQALGLIEINVSRLGVDMLTINSGKIYGPKGVGALYVARNVILPLNPGGGQENGRRSGTENVAGVIGFAAAAEDATSHISSNRKKYQKLTDLIKKELADSPVPPLFLGDPKRHLANFCPISFPGIDAERLIYHLEEQGIMVSTGAACAASKGQASHVLRAIHLTPEEIAGSLRLSLGRDNTEDDIVYACAKIKEAVQKELQLKSQKNHEQLIAGELSSKQLASATKNPKSATKTTQKGDQNV